MEINVYNNYGTITFDYEKVIRDVGEYFTFPKCASLILVDLDTIHEMNRTYRNKDYPTDVLSFPADDEDEEDYLGDIFICIEKVREQAASYGHSEQREFAFLLVHGLLHLQGYDHLTESEEKVMFTKQEEILNAIHYPREGNQS